MRQPCSEFTERTEDEDAGNKYACVIVCGYDRQTDLCFEEESKLEGLQNLS